MSAPQASRPMYLRGSCSSLFAFLHTAADPVSTTAVLICPPFGWEDMCCYRIRREWAERLARAGYATLRIDLPGSGDSAGAPGDPGQLDAWTQGVTDAARWLHRAEARQVAVIGIGLGGLVSCRAAMQGAPIDELALWSVPARGHTLLRELRAFARLEVANMLEAGESAASGDPSDSGALAVNGYVLSAETVSDLEDLDLQHMQLSGHVLRRVLLLGRDGLKVDQGLWRALERTGAAVSTADGPGFGAMTAEAQDARAPIRVFELVGSWIAEGELREQAPAPPNTYEHTTPDTRAIRGRTRTAGAVTPGESDELLLEHAGVQLRESPLLLDGPSGRLFGVLTEPLGARGELTAVLLNAGPQRRTGPNRMWVEIARRWAAQGVATVRLDADGIGDADGDTSELVQVTAFYRPRYVEQACAALEALADRGLPQRYITLGLCSGAYWGVQAALIDERVAAVVMLNPRTLVFDEWRHTVRRARQLREKALMASTWGKVLRGDIKLSKHLETGRTLVERAASTPMRVRERIGAPRGENGAAREADVREPIEDLFDRLRDRDQHGLLLFTGKEVLRNELTRNGVLDRMDRWPNLELALIGSSADTHTLTPLWLQRQVHALVDRVLEDELKRHVT
jgi:alpha-beta hydrolase superfamily lysophospholipase